MLSARTTTNTADNVVIKPNKLKTNNKLKTSTNTRKGLGYNINVNRTGGLTNRPKPLQLSTNTIHASQQQQQLQQQKNHGLNTGDKNYKKSIDNEPIKKKSQIPKLENLAQTKVTKSDENDVEEQFIPESYNPLDDIYALDEDLYQKVLKLDLADDGLPKFDTEEPFDF